MKKTRALIVLLISILTVCLALAACGKPDSPNAEYSLDTTEVTLVVGDTHQIKVTSTSDAEFTVAYESDTPDAASVNESGLVTAVKPGTAKIKATVDGNELVLNVTVEHKYALNKTSEELSVGDTLQLNVVTTPNKNVTPTWTVSPAGIVTVSDSGLVSAVAEGEATVTATVDGKTLTCKITVSEELVFYTYTLNHTSADLEKGKTLALVLTSEDRDEFDVEWESGDTDIVTVDENGVVTAVKTGKTTVEAIVDGEVVGECAINVFEYVYDYPETLSVDFGDEDAAIDVTVTPNKTTNYTYTTDKDDIITVDTNGKITCVGVGSATVTIKDGDKTVGSCVVTVNAVIEFDEKIYMHVGDTHELAITELPAGSVEKLTFTVVDGASVVELGEDGKTLTALENGTATVKAVADGKEMTCTVTVSNLYVTALKSEVLAMDKDNPIDISAGAEYWEQYISSGEINHKRYDTVAEDIIERTVSHDGKYLSDYKAWLAWSGGANGTDCDCRKCNKDTQNGGDGGWTEGGTKAYCTDVLGSTVSLDVKVFPGQSTVSIYTGGYNLKENVTVKVGDDVLGTTVIDNKGVHNSNVVTLSVDVKNATTVTIVLEFADDYGDTGHSVMSLAAVSVSGESYSLASRSANVLVGRTTAITVLNNGVAVEDEEISYVSSDDAIASVDSNGVVTGVAVGDAVITVTVNGRVRKFYVTVGAGYTYSIDADYVYLANGESHQINITSTPAGSDETVTYSIEEGDAVTVSATGLIEAVRVGTAKVSVSIEGQKLFTVDVVVGNVTVAVSDTELSGQNFVDFTLPNVVYWEHYIWSETNPKSVDSSEDDLIAMGNLQSNGAADYGARIYFDGSSGPKAHSYKDDAYKKYSNNANGVTAGIKLPAAGTYEIRVYTGVWQGINTVSLSEKTDADNILLKSTAIENISGGKDALVTFTVTVSGAAEFTLELKIDDAHVANGRCKIAGIAIVDTSIECENVPTFHRTANDVVDITAVGAEQSILDWAVVGTRMDGGDMIGEFVSASNQQGDDMPLTLNYGDGTSRNFKYNDAGVSAVVKVNNAVKKISVYATGWESAYWIQIKNAAGEIVCKSTVVPTRGNGSTASEIVFDVNVALGDEETEDWTIETKNVSFVHNNGDDKTEGNCGLAGIVLIGDAV